MEQEGKGHIRPELVTNFNIRKEPPKCKLDGFVAGRKNSVEVSPFDKVRVGRNVTEALVRLALRFLTVAMRGGIGY